MRRGQQVFIRREVRKNLALLGHQPQTQTGNFVRRPAGDILPGKLHPAAARMQDAAGRAHGGGLAHAITPQQRDEFTFGNAQLDTEQGLRITVANLDAGDAQQIIRGGHIGRASSPR